MVSANAIVITMRYMVCYSLAPLGLYFAAAAGHVHVGGSAAYFEPAVVVVHPRDLLASWQVAMSLAAGFKMLRAGHMGTADRPPQEQHNLGLLT